jgi:hypothetical protein
MLPEGKKRGGSGIWVGAQELARKQEEWDVEARVVLVRARDRGLRLCGGFPR